MKIRNNKTLVIIGLIVVITGVIGVAGFMISGAADQGDSSQNNTVDSDRTHDDDPTGVNEQDTEDSDQDSSRNDGPSNNNSSENSENENDVARERVSLTLNAETVNGRLVQDGQYTLYLSNIGEDGRKVADYNLTEGPAHTFRNLTAGHRYVVEIDPEIFPAENITISPNQTRHSTVEVGYELHGAETFLREYEVRELGIDKDGNVYSDLIFVGKATLDFDGNYHNTYVPKSERNDPSVDWFDLLYISKENTSYQNLQPTNSEWFTIDARVGPKNVADEVVMNGLLAYNRTFIREVQRDGELHHRYETEVGTIDVDPQTGYVVYADINVGDHEDIVFDRSWYSHHDSEDLEAIPDDFEPPSSDDE